MNGYVHDCELERQKRKSGMQALKERVLHYGLAKYKRKPQNFAARVNRKPKLAAPKRI
ncbi:hypothetical protein [uncultured Campylobacter sp.]|uniref:hypothetical protein n=1 Tax=uncultured Campylobacter sp. TaxID=218934 RepID=UPI00262F2F59|nr:hypothetical protein [uncultured Campylobacter sp.]